MINVGQLNETIGELEKEIQNIKSISKIYDELSKVSSEVKANKDLHRELVMGISKASEGIETTSTVLINAVDKFNQVLEDVEINIDENLIDIREGTKSSTKILMDGFKRYELDISKKLSDSVSNLSTQYDNFSKNINSKYEILNEDYINKIDKLSKIIDANSDKLSKEVMEQLNRNVRTIGAEIKNLNYEIQNSLMSFTTTKIESIESKFANKQKEDQVNAKFFKILLSISVLTGIISVVISLVK